MIKVLSSKIVEWLLNAGTVSQEDKELYEYAIYSFFFSMMPLCLVIIIGSVFGIPVESIFMILPFMLIRKFSGGFHLKSSAICFIISTLLLSLSLALIRIIIRVDVYKVSLYLASLAALQIFIYSPIDSEERKLSEKERAVFRKIARLIVSVCLSLSLLLYFCRAEKFAVSIVTGIIITALLQLPCVFTKRWKT